MTAPMLVILSFLLFRADSDALDAAEHGTVTARSCEQAEAWIRGALRPGQELLIHGCGPVSVGVASR